MSDLNLHESMIERAAKAILDEVGEDEQYGDGCREIAKKALKAAFDGVPMTNYAMGTLLGFFDLVIVVKDLDSRAAALVARRDGEQLPSEGFETLGHNVTVSWKENPSRHISGVAISKLDPPAA